MRESKAHKSTNRPTWTDRPTDRPIEYKERWKRSIEAYTNTTPLPRTFDRSNEHNLMRTKGTITITIGANLGVSVSPRCRLSVYLSACFTSYPNLSPFLSYPSGPRRQQANKPTSQDGRGREGEEEGRGEGETPHATIHATLGKRTTADSVPGPCGSTAVLPLLLRLHYSFRMERIF